MTPCRSPAWLSKVQATRRFGTIVAHDRALDPNGGICSPGEQCVSSVRITRSPHTATLNVSSCQANGLNAFPALIDQCLNLPGREVSGAASGCACDQQCQLGATTRVCVRDLRTDVFAVVQRLPSESRCRRVDRVVLQCIMGPDLVCLTQLLWSRHPSILGSVIV